MASIDPQSNAFTDLIKVAIEGGITRRLEHAWDQEVKAFVERMEREKNDAIASIAVGIMKELKFETMSDHIVITVRSKDLKQNEH